MEGLSSVFMEASERLAAKKPMLLETYRHILERKVRFLDTPRLAQRLERLMRNPLVEKALSASGVAAELRGATSLEGLSAAAQSELERVLGGTDFMPIWFLTRGAELRRTVARVRARTPDGRESAGTGFLVGPRLLLTNFHVLDLSDIGRQPLGQVLPQSLVEFDFEEIYDGRQQPVSTFRFDPRTLLLASPWNVLDYVLVALEPRSLGDGESIDSFGYNRLAGDLGKISTGEAVFIIQHANGRPKQVVVQNNRLIHIAEDHPYLTYEADTDHGSSGSPVFNRQWEVVGLHHSTEIARDAEGRILAKDGTLWRPELGSAQIRYLELNEGIRISRILADLAAKREGRAELSPAETATDAGFELLREALRTRLGASPADLVAPIPIEHSGPLPPGLPPRPNPGNFPRPD